MSSADETEILPPLEWLRVFEAAARLSNVTAAAQELGLTQAAVSQRLRNLESQLGTALFVRLPRGVELTQEGEAYAPHVAAALASLRRSTADLFSPARRSLSIAGSASVAEHWILPRLPKLWETQGFLQLSFVSVQREGDFAAAQADFEVRFGEGEWPGRQGRKLFDEVLAPVAAPTLLRQSPEDWRTLPQIALFGPRDGWREWAAASAVAPPRSPRLRFDSFSQGLSAARAGHGVLLASLALVRNDLEEGHLIRLPEPSFTMKGAYWITWREKQSLGPTHRHLVESLCQAEA